MKTVKRIRNIFLLIFCITLLSGFIGLFGKKSYEAGKASVSPQVEQTNNEFTLKIQQLQVEVANKSLENDQLRSEIEQLELEKQALIDSGVSLERIEELNTEINTLNTQITNNQNTIDALSSRCTRLLQVLSRTVTELYADDLEGLTSIREGLFSSFSSLKSIELPSTIDSIELNAFKSCTNLETVDFSRCVNLATIKGSAFYGCKKLQSVDLSNCEKLTWIFQNGFNGCASLNILKLPSSITTLGDDCFAYSNLTTVDLTNCNKLIDVGNVFGSKLETVLFPDEVEHISGSFKYLSSLKYNTYNGGKYLGNTNNPYLVFCGFENDITTVTSGLIHQNSRVLISDVFGYNSTITTIDLSSYTNLTKISYSCFNQAKVLTSVILPETITYIDENVFVGCTSLTEVRITSPVPPTLEKATNIPDTITFYVHNVDAYKSAPNWSTLTNNFVEI